MNTHQPRRGGFEQRLLNELRPLVTAQPSSGPRPLRRPRSWTTSRPRLALAGSIAALAAVAATAGVLLLAGGATPAYAVSTNDDGTVTVEINSLSDAAGLESKLREAGIHAVVQYLPPGKTCKQPWFTPVAYEHGPGHVPATSGVEHTSDVFNRFTIGTHHPTAATLVITNQAAPDADAGSAGSVESISIAWAMGEVKQCMVVDAP